MHPHKLRQRLTADQLQTIVAEYENGQPTTALTTAHGLGKGTVLNLLRDAEVNMRGQGRRNIDLAQAIERYQAGWSFVRLGAAYDCDAETVRKTLGGAGVVLRKPLERV